MTTLPTPSSAEAHLGLALASIHRILPRLDEPDRCDEVQTALTQAAAAVEAARAAHEQAMEARGAGPVRGELLAVISAAVFAALDRPYRVLDVKRSAPLVTWVNAWAMEGRFKHYASRRVR
ncbi:MAG TPA: hypothetical protein PLT00_14135 [Verrucomicrobiota bacterium]|nr:MAG: hypothetical protein BWX84_02881 [Verrucomicrobia bacterium ADurb.Bin118]HPY31505.1 hypothetical protein [Verrucomicrobiota bacterium]HQB17837.1 hypothetical protein [Verrucomicrobiota bacterium]